MAKEDWMNRKWRPAMAWMYLVVCIIDFIVFPVLWSLLQATFGGTVSNAWMPITLHGGGLFHLAIGAVLGVTAWSRGQEKLRGVHYAPDDETYYNENIRQKRVPNGGLDEEL